MKVSIPEFVLNHETAGFFQKGLFRIVKELFSSNTEFNSQNLVEEINHYIKADPLNRGTIEYILGLFSNIRTKQNKLLTIIENTISIKHSPIFDDSLPNIFILNSIKSPIFDIIRNDDLTSFLDIISKNPFYNFAKVFVIKQPSCLLFDVNLLDIAAFYGSINCFKYFLLNGAPLSDQVGSYSICGGNLEIIRLIEKINNEQYFNNIKSLNMSIICHQYEIAEWIIRNSDSGIVDIELLIKTFNYETLEFILNYRNRGLSTDYIYTACKSGNLPIFQLLFEFYKKYDVDMMRMGHMQNRLYRYRIKPQRDYSSRRFLSYLAYILGGRIDKIVIVDAAKQKPLHHACLEGHLNIIQYLCKVAKVNTEEEDEEGRTALHYACLRGHLQVVQYLCEVAKVNAEAKDYEGETPLHFACLKNHCSIVQYLCQVKKVDTETKDRIGKKPLHYVDHCDLCAYFCTMNNNNHKKHKKLFKINYESSNTASFQKNRKQIYNKKSISYARKRERKTKPEFHH